MQFLFYLIAAIILLFFFVSTLIGLIGGGNSFFDSFKKGFKFLLVTSVVLAIGYFIFIFFSNISFKPLTPSKFYEDFKNKEGLDLLTAKPYYLGLLGLSITILLSSVGEFIFVIFDLPFHRKTKWKLLPKVDFERLFLGLSTLIIAFIVFGFSKDGKSYDFIAFLALSSFFLASTVMSFLRFYFKKSKNRYFRGKEIVSEEFIKNAENIKDIEHLWNIIAPIFIILIIGYYKYYS